MVLHMDVWYPNMAYVLHWTENWNHQREFRISPIFFSLSFKASRQSALQFVYFTFIFTLCVLHGMVICVVLIMHFEQYIYFFLLRVCEHVVMGILIFWFSIWSHIQIGSHQCYSIYLVNVIGVVNISKGKYYWVRVFCMESVGFFFLLFVAIGS